MSSLSSRTDLLSIPPSPVTSGVLSQGSSAFSTSISDYESVSSFRNECAPSDLARSKLFPRAWQDIIRNGKRQVELDIVLDYPFPEKDAFMIRAGEILEAEIALARFSLPQGTLNLTRQIFLPYVHYLEFSSAAHMQAMKDIVCFLLSLFLRR